MRISYNGFEKANPKFSFSIQLHCMWLLNVRINNGHSVLVWLWTSPTEDFLFRKINWSRDKSFAFCPPSRLMRVVKLSCLYSKHPILCTNNRSPPEETFPFQECSLQLMSCPCQGEPQEPPSPWKHWLTPGSSLEEDITLLWKMLGLGRVIETPCVLSAAEPSELNNSFRSCHMLLESPPRTPLLLEPPASHPHCWWTKHLYRTMVYSKYKTIQALKAAPITE